MTKKEEMIKRVNKLGWGCVLWGYDKEGKVINVNEYFEEEDTFNSYGEDMKCHKIKFEDLPLQMWRA